MRSISRRALSELFVSLFTGDELARFLMRRYPCVHNEMPRGLSLAALADHAVLALDKRGRLDEELREALIDERPHRSNDVIRALRPTLRPEVQPKLRRRHSGRIGLTTVFGGAALVGVASLVVDVMPTGGGDDPASVGSSSEPVLGGALMGAGDVLRAIPGALVAIVRPCPEGMVVVLPAQETSLAPFCMDRLEVSRADYGLRCPMAPMAKEPSSRLHEKMAVRCERDGPSAEWGRHPVTWVQGEEAEAHCAARGGRLPRLEEWNAAAAMDLAGREERTLASCMNVCDRTCWESQYEPREHWFHHTDRYPRTAPVGSYAEPCPSPIGVSDMHGNVRELVRSGDGYAICGVGWRSYSTEHLARDRWCEPPEDDPGRAAERGFRCALDVAVNVLQGDRPLTPS